MSNSIHSEENQKMVDRVLALPEGPERWRETIKVWLLKNPLDAETGVDARTSWQLQLQENRRLREEQANKFSATESGALRLGFSIPQGAWMYLKLFNPMTFNASNVEDSRRNIRKFMKAFPELQIPEKV